MAPLPDNENNENNEMELEPAIRAHLAEYVEHEYTEEMYREHANDIFDLLQNRYRIQNPQVVFMRVNSWINVIIEYHRQVPLFELQGFGM
jgi:hypothetical protein